MELDINSILMLLAALVGGVHYVASEIVNQTSTPNPNSKWGKAYRWLEIAARVTKKAKQVYPTLKK